MGETTRCGRPTGPNGEPCERQPDHGGDCTPVIWDADDMDSHDAARAEGYAAGVEAAVRAVTGLRDPYTGTHRDRELEAFVCGLESALAAIRAATRGKT